MAKCSLLFAAVVLASAGTAGAEQACAVVPDKLDTPALKAYAHQHYAEAQEMYEGELISRPNDAQSMAGLIQSLLHEAKTNEAAAQLAKLKAAAPDSAIALTAEAEVQLHQGEPWRALETLAAVEKIDPCYARIHYVRSRVFRMDSKYGSERAEVDAANKIDPQEPDIHRAWLSSVKPAQEIKSVHESLTTMKDMDATVRQQAQDTIDSMMPLLSENNQTCKVTPALTGDVTLPLSIHYDDARRVEGYRLEVELPQSKGHLTVDTAASGLFISRALADLNGLKSSPSAPYGTVHVDSVKIGPLEFKDCIVGVSDAPFAGNSDGFVGTDLFAPWLIHLEPAGAKLTLSQLPAAADLIPGDRLAEDSLPARLQGFSPVYHRNQYLMVPVMLNNKSRRLFVLDSGMRVSTMTPEAAHAVSTTKVNFSNHVQTVGGATIEVYRDAFDFQFASLSLPQQGHIVQFDPSKIERSTGIQVAGLLGFDMLHSLDMQIDYRDGLVKFESVGQGSGPGQQHKRDNPTVEVADCGPTNDQAQPLNTTIQAKVPNIIDSNHLKAGSQVILKMTTNWHNGECYITQDSPLYGHVTDSRSSKSPASSELSITFDKVECFGGKTRDVSLKILGLIAAPDQFVGLHSALPSEVGGRGRDIAAMASDVGSGGNQISLNLNPDGPPDMIKPGIVQGLPGVKLEPRGGPGCSAKISSVERSIHLGSGAEFILTPTAPMGGGQ